MYLQNNKGTRKGNIWSVINHGILLNEIEKFTEIPENIKEGTKLTKYALITRYPGEYDEITKRNYEESITIAKGCFEWVENKIIEGKE
jgi:HEPN domain-containing protein